MHTVSYKEELKMPETKLILWIVYDIFMFGTGGISLLNSFLANVDNAEKVVIFLIFATMGLYRIRILHHSSKRKRLENEEFEAIIKERKEKMNKVNGRPRK